jgi:hypothetical protein
MSNELVPIVDQWYRHLDKGEMLRVVAVDPAARLIEIQDFDGDIEELDFDAWRDMDIDLAEAPEDWTGPYDDIETDDLGYTETAMTPQDWRTPLDAVRTDEESWQDTRAIGEREEEARPAEPYIVEENDSRKRVQ